MINFEINLRQKSETIDLSNPDGEYYYSGLDTQGNAIYDPELHDYGTVINDLCAIMEDNSMVYVRAFGIDIPKTFLIDGEDLPDLIEGVYECIIKILQKKESKLMFDYDSPVELRLIPNNEQVLLQCVSCRLHDDLSVMNAGVLGTRFYKFICSFVKIAQSVLPQLTQNDIYQEWVAEVEQLGEDLRRL